MRRYKGMSKTRKYIVITAKAVFIVLFGMFCLVIGWNALHPSRMIPLPMGYRMWETDEQEQIIEMNPESGGPFEGKDGVNWIRVGPNVDEFRVYDKAIIGHVKKPLQSARQIWVGNVSEEKPEEKTGYFVIDLTANKVYGGLSKKEWSEHLKKLGIDEDPELLEPTIYNKYVRHGRL